MKHSDIVKLDAIADEAECSVAFVRGGLNMVLIAGKMQHRTMPGSAWRINAEGRKVAAFIRQEDRVRIFKHNHIRVDIP